MATPNASPDDSLENLQRFIAVLTATIEQVHAHASAIDEQADAVEDQDGEAQGAATELADALTDLEDGLERAEHDALEELQALQETARQGAEERMSRAGTEVESAQADFEGVLDDGSARIDEAHSGLDEGGFDGLGRTVETLESALEQDRQEAVAAFDGLETALAEQEARAGSAHADAGAGMDETAEESRSQDLGIGGEVNDGISGLEAAAGAIDQTCNSVAVALEHLYGGWRDALRDEAGALITHTVHLMRDTAEAMETLAEDELSASSEEVANARFGPHLKELDGLLANLEGTPQVTDSELSPLVDGLEKALGVVETIGSLLAALE